MVKNLPAVQETQVQSLGRKDPLEKGLLSTSVFFPREFHPGEFHPGEFHGQRSLAGCNPWGLKESGTT